MRKDSLKCGDEFGRLTVIRLHHTSKRNDGRTGERIMICKCICGKELQVKTSNLKSGNTKSCGCLKSEMSTKSNLKRAGQIHDINDDIAFSCWCGCVEFNILKSKQAECASCGERVHLSGLFG